MDKYDETTMRGFYEQWQESGLSKKSFARKESITLSTFYYWSRKFDGDTKKKTSKPRSKGFTRIEPENTSLLAVTATLRYPSGVVLEWHGSPDTIGLLKGLL